MPWPAGSISYKDNKWASPSTYVQCAIALIVVTTYFVFNFGRGHRVTVPFHGNNELDMESLKKRWMTDSINLMQEGYKKVKHKDPSCILDLTNFDIYSFRIVHSKSGQLKATR